ncbi:tetratricopeptide repeat protein [Polaribacter sp. Hel1_85]|uniref:tetratricopeptide repeat protein n=1 Tax=Polaribacter sp. Hel1_85 TaxID=1250005 RepID=UPI00052DAE06|nr:tetratricopeptide repeat protein [Polaribacter sp. Hel1_85]KGL64005.1 TPR repeat protein-containing protein [Polaribacter sp. Hel1_85]
MDILRKTIVIAIVAFLGSTTIYAQNDFTNLQEAFSKSYKLEAQGDFKLAADEIKMFYKEESYEMNLRLGWLNYMAGNFNESIAFYKKSMELMPYADEPRFGYIFPLSALGRWDEVIEMYNVILENSPHNTKAMYYLGTIYYNRSEFDKALTNFKQIVDLYPFDYDGLLMYAWTNLKLGNKKEAKDLFQKVLLNKPNDASALEGLTFLK